MTEDGQSTSFLYDADGSRLISRDSTGTTLFLPGMELRLDAASGAVSGTRYYTAGDGGPVVAVRTTAGVSLLAADAQGTALLSVDASTQALTQRRFTPFGQPRGDTPAGWPTRRGFVDGVQDGSTGLTQLGAREYDPDTGRFLSADPVIDTGDPQQMNGYAYANNTPVTASDPGGLMVDGYNGNGGYQIPIGCGGCYNGGGPVKPGADVDYDYGSHSYGAHHHSSSSSASRHGSRSHAQSAAQARAAKAREAIKRAAITLAKVAAEVLGITDAFNCFTKGDIGGCVSTALTIAASFVGGFAAKIVAKYVFRFNRAIEIVRTVKSAFGDLVKGVKDLDAAKDAQRIEHAADGGGRAEGPTCNSFTAQTSVVMAKGKKKPIKAVKVGDKVTATDPTTGTTHSRPVTALIRHAGVHAMVAVTLTTGDVIHATALHPFWDQTQHQWIPATSLQTGDKLRQPGGKTIAVRALRGYSSDLTAYNLTIDTTHTYYVTAGAVGILVHNCDVPPAANATVRDLKRMEQDNDPVPSQVRSARAR